LPIPHSRQEHARAGTIAGFERFAARQEKGWALTDCISFAAMAERGLSETLTADNHFEHAGFRAVFK
jgi:hypothetical protein